MFKWITAQFRKQEPPKPQPRVKHHLTRKEKLHAILISYKVGKIDLDRAIDLIHIWRLLSDK